MSTKLENLTKRKKSTPKKRVGRGNASGKGTYATRGLKGQRSRSGGRGGLKRRSMMKQLIKKMPKMGGFKPIKKNAKTITLANLELKYTDGDTVSIKSLQEKKFLKKMETRAKIVSSGKLTKKLTIENIPCTKSAGEQIKTVGGTLA